MAPQKGEINDGQKYKYWYVYFKDYLFEGERESGGGGGK